MKTRVLDAAAMDEIRLIVARQELDPSGGPVRQVRCRECGFVLGSANTKELFTPSGPIRIEPTHRPSIRCCCGEVKVFR